MGQGLVNSVRMRKQRRLWVCLGALVGAQVRSAAVMVSVVAYVLVNCRTLSMLQGLQLLLTALLAVSVSVGQPRKSAENHPRK